MKYIVKFASAAFVCVIMSTSFAAGKEPQRPPTIVTLSPAKTIEWAPSVEAIGSVYAYQGTTISGETPGRITHIYFKSGQIVKKGEPLVQIFPDVLEATLRQQQAQLHSDKLTFQRDTRLVKIGAVSQAAYDTALSDVQQDQANVESTKAQLTQRNIKAPFTGKVGLRTINVGEYIKTGDPIVGLQQIDPLYIDFSIPGTDLADIDNMKSIKITSHAYPGKVFTGTVYASNASIDPDTRMLKLRAKLDNKDHLLLPGSFVNVTMNLSKKRQAIVIPETSLVYSEQGPYVYILTPKNTVRQQYVTLGPRLLENEVVAFKGVKPGDQLVNGGQLKLSNGAPAMTLMQAKAYFAKQQMGKEKK